jgi:hypothetical protein
MKGRVRAPLRHAQGRGLFQWPSDGIKRAQVPDLAPRRLDRPPYPAEQRAPDDRAQQRAERQRYGTSSAFGCPAQNSSASARFAGSNSGGS